MYNATAESLSNKFSPDRYHIKTTMESFVLWAYEVSSCTYRSVSEQKCVNHVCGWQRIGAGALRCFSCAVPLFLLIADDTRMV